MNNRQGPFLFAAGFMALAWGAVSFYVEQRLELMPAFVSALGGVIMVTGLIRSLRPDRGHFMVFPWRRAACLGLGFCLCAVFFVGVNVLVLKVPWRWDVTQFRQHTLTAGTTDLLKGLKKEVQLTALYVGIPPSYLEDLLKEYARVSEGRIKTEIVDPIEQIGYAAQFGDVIDSSKSRVIVRSGVERRDIDFSGAPLSEGQLTEAVVRVTRRERQICFLTGHSEYSLTDKGARGLTSLALSLKANNMQCREVMLGIEPEVPAECHVLVVAGPHEELTEKEEAQIDRYLKQGGDALFLTENVVVTTPDKPLTEEEFNKNPSLNRILNQWGLNVEPDLVVDLSSHAGDDAGCPATRNYGEHEAITAGLDYTFYIRPRSISILKERRPSIRLAPVVRTMSADKSWAETDRMLRVVFDPLLDTAGPVTLSYVLWEEKEAADLSDTRMIVFTDADFLTNSWIDQYSNSRMGLNVINWLAESDPGHLIEESQVRVERLDLTSRQRRVVAAVLFLMPLIIAIGGIFVWMKR